MAELINVTWYCVVPPKNRYRPPRQKPWQFEGCIDDSGRVYLPGVLFGKSKAVSLCAAFAGVPIWTSPRAPRTAFWVSAEWAKTVYPHVFRKYPGILEHVALMRADWAKEQLRL